MRKRKTTALEMMKRDREKDPELQRLYEEEKLKYEIALMIREYRERLGLTQAQLAKKIKTSQSTIARLEDTDYEGYSMQTLQRVADALKCRLIIKFEPLSPAA
ncbi:MAG: helix-turn-helix transcriptional regulator [Deltaproteobacteria bacterium]|nr:helix-turn-helix transcriptional regulator [Deltaproteobacteria bacterium]